MKPVSKMPSTVKQLKIALVIDDSLDELNGAPLSVVALGAWLQRQGHQVVYVTSVSDRTDIEVYSFSKLYTLHFNGNLVRTPYAVNKRAIRQFVQQHHFDIVHIQSPHSPFLTGFLLRQLPATTKVVANLNILPRGFLAHCGIWFLKKMLWRSWSKIDVFVPITLAAKTYFERTWRLHNLPVIPSAINLDDFNDTMQRTYHQPGYINLVFLGRLTERKGCIDLLQAIHLLPQELQDKLYVHIGGRGELATQIEQAIAHSPLQERIQQYGLIDQADKANFLASGDLLVFPSRGGESFGISLIEALAARYGVVLGAHNDGYATVLGQRPKVMFPPSQPAQLANCLKYWLQVPPAIKANQLAWQQAQLKQYDLKTVVGPRLMQLYSDII